MLQSRNSTSFLANHEAPMLKVIDNMTMHYFDLDLPPRDINPIQYWCMHAGHHWRLKITSAEKATLTGTWSETSTTAPPCPLTYRLLVVTLLLWPHVMASTPCQRWQASWRTSPLWQWFQDLRHQFIMLISAAFTNQKHEEYVDLHHLKPPPNHIWPMLSRHISAMRNTAGQWIFIIASHSPHDLSFKELKHELENSHMLHAGPSG